MPTDNVQVLKGKTGIGKIIKTEPKINKQKETITTQKLQHIDHKTKHINIIIVGYRVTTDISMQLYASGLFYSYTVKKKKVESTLRSPASADF